MYIKQEFIEKLKSHTDIVDIIGHYAQLKKQGKNWFCLSPFGSEKTASCCVDPVKQRYTDYSSDRHGDAINFLMEKENLTYPEAIEYLARHYGWQIEYEDQEWAEKKAARAKKKEAVRPLLQAAHRRYIAELRSVMKDQPGHPATREILRREYDDADIAEWGIGFAPGGTFIYDELKQINRLADGQSVFLVGDKYDKYWNRVIYPIHDENNLLVGFAGRDVSTGGKKTGKWINPADSDIYRKDKTWFALHKAKKAIQRQQEAWILEGYNDVIAWHKAGVTNTIAPCGTSITDTQMTLLKRYCSRVIFAMDPDAAGQRSMLKYIEVFLKMGYDVEVVILPKDTRDQAVDPDDLYRLMKPYMTTTEQYTLWLRDLRKKQNVPPPEALLLHYLAELRRNGFTKLLENYLFGWGLDGTEPATDLSEMETVAGARRLLKVVAAVSDEPKREIYMKWVAKESGVKPTTLNRWLKDEEAVLNEAVEESFRKYTLPKGIRRPIKELLPDIEKYGLFIENNQIWMATGDDGTYNFYSVSNFSIEIIQHMQDEKLPMKLVRICNIHGDERIFDVPSESLNTPMAFDKAMTDNGNFLFSGGRNEFQKLRRYLYDRMGVGHKIEVLGWQPEGFWVWNNYVTTPGQGSRQIDENGVYKIIKEDKRQSYYIPSANRIYEHNSFKYTPQKKVVLHQPKVSFTQYAGKMMEVHRKHAITGLLFTVATTFLDIIEDKLGNFPLLFLYGPPSSGKDQLIDCCQSFFGTPQSPIHIGNKISTSKAQVRKFAQFRNIVVHLSEYRPGDQMIDELLKGFWDRRGYERGTIDSAYGTETVPINSSVIFTGNHYPDDDALITRVIAEEMTKTEFNAQEKKSYSELKDMYKAGISGFTDQMLQHRQLWEDGFKEKFHLVEANMKKDLTMASTHDRMIGNAAVLGTAYELMKDVVQFPFSFNDYLSHTRDTLTSQIRKLNTASTVMRWWDCFLASVRTKTDPIKHGREFEIKDSILYFNFTHTYNRVVMQWWAQYHEQVPSKSKITDTLKKDSAFMEEKGSHRMAERKSSVWMMNLELLPIASDLEDAVEWQRLESNSNPGFGSLANDNSKPKTDKNDGIPELPF